MKMSKKSIDNAIETLGSWYGVHLTPQQLLSFIKGDLWLSRDISLQKGGGLDTLTREKLITSVALNLTGEDWPVNCTPAAKATKFFIKFKAAAKKKGVHVLRA